MALLILALVARVPLGDLETVKDETTGVTIEVATMGASGDATRGASEVAIIGASGFQRESATEVVTGVELTLTVLRPWSRLREKLEVDGSKKLSSNVDMERISESSINSRSVGVVVGKDLRTSSF